MECISFTWLLSSMHRSILISFCLFVCVTFIFSIIFQKPLPHPKSGRFPYISLLGGLCFQALNYLRNWLLKSWFLCTVIVVSYHCFVVCLVYGVTHVCCFHTNHPSALSAIAGRIIESNTTISFNIFLSYPYRLYIYGLPHWAHT